MNDRESGEGRTRAGLTRLVHGARGYGARTRAAFAGVTGNARVVVLTEGLAGIPHLWYSTYASLYMLALGVTATEVGLLASLLSAVKLLSTLAGGHVADRFGRKRVLVLGDLFGWCIPMALFAVARSPWYFWVGTVINGMVYLVLPAFQCLFVEDVAVERRPIVFGCLQIMMAVASLFAPVAGLMVASWGMIPAGRAMAAFAGLGLFSTAVMRQFTLHETTMGEARISAARSGTLVATLREYAGTVGEMLAQRRMRTYLTVRIIDTFDQGMWGAYLALYLTDAHGLGLAKASIAVLPFVSSVVTILMLVLGARTMRSDRNLLNLAVGQGLWLISALCYVISPAGTLALVIIGAVIGAISRAIYRPADQSYWADIVGDWQRAKVFSVGGALVSLFALPAGALAAGLYGLAPRAPFVLALVLGAISLALIVTRLRGMSSATPVT